MVRLGEARKVRRILRLAHEAARGRFPTRGKGEGLGEGQTANAIGIATAADLLT